MTIAAPQIRRPIETEYRPRHPLDLRRTVLYQRRGGGDPTMTVAGTVIWRASRTPEGVATLALREDSSGNHPRRRLGSGAAGRSRSCPRCAARSTILGDFDAVAGIRSSPRRTTAIPACGIGRTDLFFDALASAIFEQKVTGMQAFGAWRRIVTWFGERAPGPDAATDVRPAEIDGWRHVPSWAWHRAGLEPPQARTVVESARRGETIGRVFVDGDRRRGTRPRAHRACAASGRGPRPRRASVRSATPMR